ncbi:alpha-L-rhamnosidase [Aspergillus luchuensis]|uniref:Alpha-L-rhamnosidase n=1 Tax=Aspergillus kawachii TaxID=1069201 RepID=A0A146G2T3_ASPKA|nr:alpha-L-rhamnosidase [Aspergillus luchuensis]
MLYATCVSAPLLCSIGRSFRLSTVESAFRIIWPALEVSAKNIIPQRCRRGLTCKVGPYTQRARLLKVTLNLISKRCLIFWEHPLGIDLQLLSTTSIAGISTAARWFKLGMSCRNEILILHFSSRGSRL